MSTNTSLIPSGRDLVMVLPRLAQRAGIFAYNQIPEHVDLVLNRLRHGGSVIADATSINKTAATVTKTATSAFVQSTQSAAGMPHALPEGGFLTWLSAAMNMESFRGFGGMFSYFGSRWALVSFAMSIFLNRTHFYASSRQNLDMRFKTRSFLYLAPIALLTLQSIWILQAMKCQTSPVFSELRYGDATKQLAMNFGGEAGFLYNLSTTLLFWQDDAQSCAAMKMSRNEEDVLAVHGSFAVLWPFFVTICVSQFVETLACALQGRQPMPETGMTMFEHSLAFAECEAMISNAFGLGVFGPAKSDKSADTSSTSSSDALLLTRSMILKKLNVPPEVLLISFISCLSHLSSSLLAVSGKRHQFRLINTAVWAVCYLSAFIWSFIRVLQHPFGTDSDLGILRFPTVCIIGFVPHIMILAGIAMCGIIYSLAILLTVMSPPPDAPRGMILSERVSFAVRNLQANVQFTSSSSIKLNWNEDFYTNLLKVGFAILTAASEAVYLNEASRVKIHSMTWLERKRLGEIMRSRDERYNSSRRMLADQDHVQGLQFVSDSVDFSQSGYTRERKAQAKSAGNALPLPTDSGVGVADRRSKWVLVGELYDGIFALVKRITGRTIHLALALCGIAYRPAWLIRLSTTSSNSKITPQSARSDTDRVKNFWLIGPNGELKLPVDRQVDVEQETRRRMLTMSADVTDDMIDDKLYSWWSVGGWWGDIDSSGEYQPATHDTDDTTSLLSATESTATSSAWTDEEASGQQTPTANDSHLDGSQRINLEDLARLLDPQSASDRDEARILSRHLQSDGIMTRSRFRKRLNAEGSQVLMPSARRVADAEADEETALEQFILMERQKALDKASSQAQSWAAGADGMGAGGPQCVVCQSAPRSILVWPCGCLSICDDCRVGVAARNFGTCLCCRTNVVAYSRLYVP